MDINLAFLIGTSITEDEILDYWRLRQAESGLIPEVFILKIKELLKSYRRNLRHDAAIRGHDPYLFGMPLLFISGGALTGHLYMRDLDYVDKSITQYDSFINNIESNKLDGIPSNELVSKVVKVTDNCDLESLCNCLAPFFNSDDINRLKELLKKGTMNGGKLTFNGKTNQLGHTFRLLYDNRLIYQSIDKTDLMNWIIDNFYYLHRGEIKEVRISALEDVVSKNSKPCKNPIIQIEDGVIASHDPHYRGGKNVKKR